ncbi:hypothetical protein BW733_02685 [Tessaracoccus flavescens]|uniref:Uncharacterized protein n=1 Tax=Tessaracoccus flavescens TaxID=399497 RepID=A0A1Q2CUX7_9ACTN|nr:hypothetical protein BW733_02685 [Tessaracoccus flavescens]
MILAHVADRADGRLRLVVGDDAPAQLEAVLEARIEDYRRDPDSRRWGEHAAPRRESYGERDEGEDANQRGCLAEFCDFGQASRVGTVQFEVSGSRR